MTSRGKLIRYRFLCIIFLAALLSCSRIDSQRIQKNIMIPMRDNVHLATNITLPSSQGVFPVILVRTPYGKDNEEDDWGGYWADNGFAFVIQDCRGTGTSEGEWYPGKYDKKDGIDTHSWILIQSWCDGNIGTTGGSYLGYTQLVSCTESSEALKAMFPVIPLMDWYTGTTYINGAMSIGTVMSWGLEMAAPAQAEGALINEETWNWDHVFRTLPLIEFDQNVGRTLPWMRDWIGHPVDGAYWDTLGARDLKKKCDIPLITVSGWYDIFVHQALDYHSAAIESGKAHQHLIVGPWAHGPNFIPGDREMDKNHELDFESMELGWFNFWLKEEGQAIDLPPVKLYVMGKNYWRDENKWPLERTKYAEYYFHSGGKANALNGDGAISIHKPANDHTDQFIYDPENPVPTHGGAILFGEPGVYDQRKIEGRNDVLVYTSESLKEELEVTGPVRVILYASTDAKDTDWTAKLLDVYPDSRAYNLCDGVIRARYHRDPLKPELIEPGEVYRYEIDLWSTSNVFLPGHKIRVEISSSNFPRFDRNPNTGNPFGMDSELRKAKQTVYHNSEYASHIVLPVIPGL